MRASIKKNIVLMVLGLFLFAYANLARAINPDFELKQFAVGNFNLNYVAGDGIADGELLILKYNDQDFLKENFKATLDYAKKEIVFSDQTVLVIPDEIFKFLVPAKNAEVSALTAQVDQGSMLMQFKKMALDAESLTVNADIAKFDCKAISGNKNRFVPAAYFDRCLKKSEASIKRLEMVNKSVTQIISAAFNVKDQGSRASDIFEDIKLDVDNSKFVLSFKNKAISTAVIKSKGVLSYKETEAYVDVSEVRMGIFPITDQFMAELKKKENEYLKVDKRRVILKFSN